MNPQRITDLIQVYRDGLLGDTIPFWTRHAPDREFGGFLTFLDADGTVVSTDKPMWVAGRISWLFARLYNVEGRRIDARIAGLRLDYSRRWRNRRRGGHRRRRSPVRFCCFGPLPVQNDARLSLRAAARAVNAHPLSVWPARAHEFLELAH